MIRSFRLALVCATSACWILRGADLPPDATMEIPESAKRETVVSSSPASFGPLPGHQLSEGFTLEIAADAPLVTHPIMGCLDDRGRLFVGDAVGVNWNKEQLEKSPPNRVLMLEDTDADGRFDKSTVFADKMTFPQGACWLDGSLYVSSPPGLWKLTDTDGDGVADEREMIVDGFDYTGNAADVHGPFLNPVNGRLYWCHGRKGHKAVQKDGTVVDESMACGIWSCEPDGSDIAWHSLGCGDNPVEVDFTPEGDIIGVQNLYYNQPRGDVIVHWLYGGVYERPDQMKAISHLQRTLETMPVMYNFGHVAVSGSCFWKRYGVNEALNFMVTHFNTQRVVRMELTPSGSTYKAVENEFLKVNDPDVHFTDVLEDPRDGSLLVIDTGGWFRIGCPSSLMAKSDLLGAVYRVKGNAELGMRNAEWKADGKRPAGLEAAIADLKSEDPPTVRRALEWISETKTKDSKVEGALMVTLAKDLDPPQEHAVIHACTEYLRERGNIERFVSFGTKKFEDAVRTLTKAKNEGERQEGSRMLAHMDKPYFMRRLIRIAELGEVKDEVLVRIAGGNVSSHDEELACAALSCAARFPELSDAILVGFSDWVSKYRAANGASQSLGSGHLQAIENRDMVLRKIEFFVPIVATGAGVADLVAELLGRNESAFEQCGLRLLASGVVTDTLGSIESLLDTKLQASPTPLLFDALKALRSDHFDQRLSAVAADEAQPLAIRLKALDSAKSVTLNGPTFEMVRGVLADASSTAAARIQAAEMIASSPATQETLMAIAPLFASVGPVELKSLLGMMRRVKDADAARAVAGELAKNPAIASRQESHYRQAFSGVPPEIFEEVVRPAYGKATEAIEAKKRELGGLAAKAATSGDAEAGKKHFEMGKGTCIACHKIGETGRAIGPDLSKIGAIRTERDLLESILFPSNTLARDYEAHVIETKDGQQILGVIKSHTAEGLLVVDAAGQEVTVAHDAITGDTTLTTSIMPMGLDQTMPEQELLDLVAFLRSLK